MVMPKLRFKADDGTNYPDWKEDLFGNLFYISAGGDIDKNNSSKKKSDKYPYKVFANALTDEGVYGYANYYRVDGDTLTITGRGDVGHAIARHEKYVPIVRLLVCQPKHDENVDFFAEKFNLTRIFIECTGVPQLTAPQVSSVKVIYPSVSEQQKIALFLSFVNEVVAKSETEVAIWEKRKKGVMQKIFSQEVRFKKDDGSDYPDWEEKTVSEVFFKVKDKNVNGKNTNVITNSAEFGLVKQRDFFDKDIAVDGKTENYTVIKKGDFVYNPRKSKQAPYGPFNCYRLPEDGIVSPLYTCLTPKYPEYTDYLLLYFQSSAWHRYIYNNGAQGGARHDRVGMTDDLMQGIPITLPCLEEQQKIADCLSALDDVINQCKAEVEDWKLLKKGLLQQMFV